MKRSFLGVLIVLLCSLVIISGCKKKTQTTARAPVDRPAPVETASPTAPSPTVELSATPTSIQRGASTMLKWSSGNADSIVIDSGVGNVGPEGSVSISPLESTTYTATASGAGGEAKASARITVVRGEDRGEISQTDVQALRQAIAEGNVRPVFFGYDSAELSAEARQILEENSRWFRQYQGASIVVEGHCDERGSEEYNLALGDRRAQAATSYLVQLGIGSDRLESISYGEEQPFDLGHSESAWTKNRRAQFVIE
jgi:peptidoglycan-associated lipoprotein